MFQCLRGLVCKVCLCIYLFLHLQILKYIHSTFNECDEFQFNINLMLEVILEFF